MAKSIAGAGFISSGFGATDGVAETGRGVEGATGVGAEIFFTAGRGL
jgi:hypothetical protein